MASSTPSDDPIPNTLKRMENDLGKTARYIWQNIEDPTQREHQLRGLFGDAYPQIEQEIAHKYPPSAEEISVRDMSKSAFGRELYNAILNLTAKVNSTCSKLDQIEETQRIQGERAERDHQSIIDFGNSLKEIRQKTDAITEKLKIDSQAVAELKAVTISAEKEQKSLSAEVMKIQINTEQQQKKLSADIHRVKKEIRQKTDAITEKLEIDSQAVAELKAVTISAEKEQKSLSAEVMKIQESLNGLIESTSETKRKQDLIYAIQFWEDKRKFEKFIGRWKMVKSEENGVEENISKWANQSDSFEPVPEGVMFKHYKKDGTEYSSWILTTDKEIKNKLRKEGKNCDLVEFQSDGSFKLGVSTYNVEGNHLIVRWGETVVTFEKC